MKSLSGFPLRAIYVFLAGLALSATGRDASAAEIEDVAGNFEVSIGIYLVQQGGNVRIADWGGDLAVQAGAPAGGALRILEQGKTIPFPLTTVEAADEGVKLGFTLSGINNRTELEAISGLLPFPVFSGAPPAELNINFEGLFSLNEAGEINGNFEALGFSFPGQFDSMHFAVSGPRVGTAPAAELPPPPEMEEAPAEEPELVEPDLDLIAEDTYEAERETVVGLELADYTAKENLIELAAARAIADREKAKYDIEIRRRKLTGVHTYDFTLNGSEEEVAVEAGVNALVASAARLYSGENVLLGRRVLEPYLRNSGGRFILTNKILERGVESDGQNRYRTRVTVDADLLYEDLESKHFIARSKFRPMMSVTLRESVGGERSFRGLGRSAVEDELIDSDMLVETENHLDPDAIHMDLTRDAATFRRMIDEAQRIDVDAIITGSLQMTEPESRLILYDELYFVTARLNLNVYRVDNGQLLRTVTKESSLARATSEEAIEAARSGVARSAAEALGAGLIDEWQAMMLDRSDHRLTVIGIDEPTLERFASKFQESFPNSRMTVKSHFGSVAVLNIDEADAGGATLEEFLRASRSPHFEVKAMGRGRFELRAL